MKPQHLIMFFGFWLFFFLAITVSTYIRQGWDDWIFIFVIIMIFCIWKLYGFRKYVK